jgi:hypothetical protein
MYYVLRLAFSPAGGFAWGVAYAGADRAEALAAFGLVRPDGVWCLAKALGQRQDGALGQLYAVSLAQRGAGTGFEWPLHEAAVARAVERHQRDTASRRPAAG